MMNRPSSNLLKLSAEHPEETNTLHMSDSGETELSHFHLSGRTVSICPGGRGLVRLHRFDVD